MPEIQTNRNSKICDSLAKSWCEECAKIGSTDCIDHGGRLSAESTVLGKRLGFDAFGEFCENIGQWDKGLHKPLTKRPNAASSYLFSSDRDSFLGLPTPKLVGAPPSRPASSRVASPSLVPKTVPQSTLESSSFAIPSPAKAIKPIPSVPTLIKPTVPVSALAVEAPSTEAVALPNDPSTPSDIAREQGLADPDIDENGYKEGGVRFRENLGKYVVEYRPPRFKWKLWMGTYATLEEGRRACDCARFYAGQDKGGFYFKDSPALFGDLGPLNRPFALVSKDVKDKAFNVELKKRAKQVIRKVLDAQRSKQAVDATGPTVKKPLPDGIVQSLQVLSARTNGRSGHLSSSSQESLPNSAVADSGHEENELAESAQQEVVSATLEAGDRLTNLDPFTNLDPLSDAYILNSEFPSSSVFIPSFNMINSAHHDLQGCIQGSLDYTDDFTDDLDLSYVKLWNYDGFP